MKSRVLLVDDNANNLTILSKVLGDEGYELREAQSGLDALAEAHDFLPDLILLDVMMPGLDGLETCRRIRAEPDLSHTKIVMVSAKGQVLDRLQGYAAGADDYIAKPFDHDELLAKVRVFLRLKNVEELEAFQRSVLSMLAHETRTPLTGILAPLEIMGFNQGLSPDDADMLQTATSNAQRLRELLERVLRLSSLKLSQELDETVSVDLAESVREVCSMMKCAHDLADAELVVEVEPVSVAGDAAALTDVVEALLDNAIRYGVAPVWVELKVVGACVKVSVVDHGSGIESAHLPYVFEAFNEPDVNHHSQGQGLSLALAREVARLHGGRLEVESRPGRTEFRLQIPIGQLAETREPARTHGHSVLS